MLRSGLFIYDHLSFKNTLKKSAAIHLKKHASGDSLKECFQKGLTYSDCQTNDSRLVILNAIAARDLGADCLSYTKLINAERHADYWDIELQCQITGKRTLKKCACLINATGPWAGHVLNGILNVKTNTKVQLVAGSHIIIPKKWPQQHAYIFQQKDGRVVFAIPYLKDYTLIGTTDVSHQGDPQHAAITDAEIDYLLNAVNHYFKSPVRKEEIIGSFCGVRPLFGSDVDPSKLSREFKIEINHTVDGHQTTSEHKNGNAAPLVNIFGGKLTTYRLLAEEVLQKIKPFFPKMKDAWTAKAPLPGGDIPITKTSTTAECFQLFTFNLQKKYPFLNKKMATNLASRYGTRCEMILGEATSIDDLGEHFGYDLYAAEINYLYKHEFVKYTTDVTHRRTQLHYKLSSDEISRLEKHLKSIMTTTPKHRG